MHGISSFPDCFSRNTATLSTEEPITENSDAGPVSPTTESRGRQNAPRRNSQSTAAALSRRESALETKKNCAEATSVSVSPERAEPSSQKSTFDELENKLVQELNIHREVLQISALKEEPYKKGFTPPREYADSVVQTVIENMVRQISGLSDDTTTQADMKRKAKAFLDDTVAMRYLFDQDGTPSILEGTPKGGLSSETEFQKTMGSYLALIALHAGYNIFGSPPGSENSLENRLRELFNSVNAHFGGRYQDKNEPMTSVLAIHDILKSRDMSRHVEKKLENNPVEISGLTYSVDKFIYLDHDTKLLVALHLMEQESLSGTDKSARSLTSLFFPPNKIANDEHREIVSAMKGMWGTQLNLLQTNQGENHPAQLKPFLQKVIESTDAEYDALKFSLKAYSVHEATDLMGAANPLTLVLPVAVVEPLLNMFDKLVQYADELRRECKTMTSPVDIDEKAREFYMALLPKMDAATRESAINTLGNDALVATLVSRLGRICHVKDLGLVIKALDQLRTNDRVAYDSLCNMYGNLNAGIYLYYAPSLIQNIKNITIGAKPFSEENISRLTDALHVLGAAVGLCAAEVEREGGTQGFSGKYGTNFFDARELCLGILKEQGYTFNPANLELQANANSLLIRS